MWLCYRQHLGIDFHSLSYLEATVALSRCKVASPVKKTFLGCSASWPPLTGSSEKWQSYTQTERRWVWEVLVNILRSQFLTREVLKERQWEVVVLVWNLNKLFTDKCPSYFSMKNYRVIWSIWTRNNEKSLSKFSLKNP